jgi:transcriptional regulator with XRE-family HTH domain
MMTIGSRIKKIRIFLKLSRSAFEPNISSSTLRHWENDTYEPKDVSLLDLIETFKKHGATVSTSWIKTGKGSPPKINGISISPTFDDEIYLKNQKSGSELEKDILEKDEILFRDVNRIKGLYAHCDSLLVCTSEMSPRFKVGDYVFGAKIDYKKYKIIDLEPSIVTVKNGKTFLCYFSYNKETDKISFIYDHGTIDFRKTDVVRISIVVIHRRCIHFL